MVGTFNAAIAAMEIKMKLTITRQQFDSLKGFYAHCYVVYHEGVNDGFAFWAEQLDKEEVPWSVQNTVAVLAEDRSSISLNLSTHLSRKGITIQ